MVARFRFTDFPLIAGDYYHFRDTAYGAVEELTLWDSQIRGGKLFCEPGQPYQKLNLTNSLFERVDINYQAYAPISVFAFNNLFKDGSLALKSDSGTNWMFKDNIFDKTAVSDYEAGLTNTIVHDYNGYVTNCNRLNTPYGGHDVILTNSPDFQTSYCGRYYLPTNSPLLSAGSRTADLAGLYQYTCLTNQTKEATNIVSMGVHWVAFDPNTGLPYDSDGDGIPDYLEDRNGNGVVNGSETDWQSYNSRYGIGSGPGLQVFTPLR
jgi:hypothetical protein